MGCERERGKDSERERERERERVRLRERERESEKQKAEIEENSIPYVPFFNPTQPFLQQEESCCYMEPLIDVLLRKRRCQSVQCCCLPSCAHVETS